MDCGGTRAEIVAQFTPGSGLVGMNSDDPAPLRALGDELAAAFGVGSASVEPVWHDGTSEPPYKLLVGKCRGGVYATVPIAQLQVQDATTDQHLDLVRIASNDLDVMSIHTAWVRELVPGWFEVDVWYTTNAKAWGVYDAAGRQAAAHSGQIDGLYVGGMRWFSFEAEGGTHVLGVGEASRTSDSGIQVAVIRPDGRVETVYTVLGAGDGC